MIAPTQPTTNDKPKAQRQEEDCVVPQYASNSMSVRPADRNGGSYYIIYHRDVSSGDCRDDETTLSNDGIRRYSGAERDDDSCVCATTKKSVKFVATNDSQNIMYDTNTGRRSRRRSEQCSPISILDDVDHNDDDDSGFASHAADACVACSIPVLHFLQFFMC